MKHWIICGRSKRLYSTLLCAASSTRRTILSFTALLIVAGMLPATAEEALAPPAYVKAFDLAFTPGFTWPGDDKEPVPFEVIDGGQLSITSGDVVATDPFVMLERPAFTQKVPNGRHPVRFAHARVHGAAGGRIAFARVDFSTQPIATWRMATIPGNDPATLKPGYIFGYPVDAGTGSFFDRQAAVTVFAQLTAKTRDENYSETWIDAGEIAGKAKGLNYYFEETVAPHNIIMFQSGWGDGYYASYFGYAADGAVAALVTDFQVMDWSLAALPK